MDNPSSAAKSAAAGASSFLSKRLYSLDAYRGLIMITLAFNGFGLYATARNLLKENPDSSFWQVAYHNFEHVEWSGCGYWDLIQPSFMFMVGAAMAFSYTKRAEQGKSYPRLFGHAVLRSLILIFLGIFLISNGRQSTNWSLMNVLTQMGLGYTLLFLLWGRSVGVQTVCAALLLIGTWCLYVFYPGTGIDIQKGAPQVGVSEDWAQKHLQGINSPWHKNANAGHFIDLWLLNQFPQPEPKGRSKAPPITTANDPTAAQGGFHYNDGGYQTINFIPELATMLFGLMCGELLRGSRSGGQKFLLLVVAGSAGLVVGLALDWTGVCPLVKRIWTPSWTLFSTGWCCLILAGFYGVVDVVGFRWWIWPLAVVGVNSIAIYCMEMLLKSWSAGTLRTHLGQNIFQGQLLSYEQLSLFGYTFGMPLWSANYQPMAQDIMVGLVFWLICLWMYRHKIFVRI